MHHPRAPAPQVTALQIAALKRLRKGMSLFILDRTGGGSAKAVAKALAERGFGRVYVIKGGFQGWQVGRVWKLPWAVQLCVGGVGGAHDQGRLPELAGGVGGEGFQGGREGWEAAQVGRRGVGASAALTFVSLLWHHVSAPSSAAPCRSPCRPASCGSSLPTW